MNTGPIVEIFQPGGGIVRMFPRITELTSPRWTTRHRNGNGTFATRFSIWMLWNH